MSNVDDRSATSFLRGLTIGAIWSRRRRRRRSTEG
jgi:hypothetical protein